MYPYRKKVSITFDPAQGMTRQEFQRECNINHIMAKYQKTGVVDHLAKHAPEYGTYDPVDFQQALETIRQGEEMFSELPSTVRKYFDNDPAEFMTFVQDPNNIDKLVELGLATPKPAESLQITDPVPTHTPESDNAT